MLYRFACASLLMWLGLLPAWALSPGPSAVPASRPASTTAQPVSSPAPSLNVPARPGWQDLDAAQQASLRPLAANWDTLTEAHKRKWLALAKNYAKLSPAEQAKLHSRMTEWVSLSQQQRTQARLNFAQAKQIEPGKKAATWQAYQALSPEEKKKLATTAPAKPLGAATAIRPVAPQKLAKIPAAKVSGVHPPKVSASGLALQKGTLLPYAAPNAAKADPTPVASAPQATGSAGALPSEPPAPTALPAKE